MIRTVKACGTGESVLAQIPVGPGTYAVVMRLDANKRVLVGALGEIRLCAGYCVYIGSALGGLRGRLKRYIAGPRRLYWHVDYLLQAASLVELWYAEGTLRAECDWAQALARSGLRPAAARFGSSDCRCLTHLYYSPGRPNVCLLAADSVPDAG